MWFPFASGILLLVGIVLSKRDYAPWIPTVMFGLGKALFALLFGFTLTGALIYGVIALSLGYAYFMLLRMTSGRVLWWFVVAAGVALIP